MPESPSRHTLVVVLSVALGASLLVIAFLLGRESARAPVTAQAEVPAQPVLEPDGDAVAETTEERRWPEWADLEEWEDVLDPDGVEPVSGRIEERPDGTLLLSNRRSTTNAPEVTSDSLAGKGSSSVSGYFLRMDVIRSEAGAGDPNAFAMDLIKAAMGGSTSGFDQLIADTQRMEQEARKVAPPPSCEGYHQANLAALAESREILEEMKSAIARRDIGELTTIAQRAGTLQREAQALQAMREQIIRNAER